MTKRLALGIAILCYIASATSQQDQRRSGNEAALYMLASLIAMATVGIEECTRRYGPRMQQAKADFERIRSDHLELFSKLENSDDYKRAAMEWRKGLNTNPESKVDEYCSALPEMKIFPDLSNKLEAIINMPDK